MHTIVVASLSVSLHSILISRLLFVGNIWQRLGEQADAINKFNQRHGNDDANANTYWAHNSAFTICVCIVWRAKERHVISLALAVLEERMIWYYPPSRSLRCPGWFKIGFRESKIHHIVWVPLAAQCTHRVWELFEWIPCAKLRW